MKRKLLGLLCALALSSSASAAVTESYQDWWGNPELSGMGVNIGQQNDTLVVTWYHFSEDGRGTYLMLSGELDDALLSGDLYRTSGPQPGPDYNPAQVVRTKVGSASLVFTSGSQAELTYRYEGKVGKIRLQRFVFKQPTLNAAPVTGALYVLDKECKDKGAVVGTNGAASYEYEMDIDPEDGYVIQFGAPDPQPDFAQVNLESSGGTPVQYKLAFAARASYGQPHEYELDGEDGRGSTSDRTHLMCSYTFAFASSAQGLSGTPDGSIKCDLTMSGAQLRPVQGTYTGPIKVSNVSWIDDAVVVEYSAQTKYKTAVCNEEGKMIFRSKPPRLN